MAGMCVCANILLLDDVHHHCNYVRMYYNVYHIHNDYCNSNISSINVVLIYLYSTLHRSVYMQFRLAQFK